MKHTIPLALLKVDDPSHENTSVLIVLRLRTPKHRRFRPRWVPPLFIQRDQRECRRVGLKSAATNAWKRLLADEKRDYRTQARLFGATGDELFVSELIEAA